MKLDKETVLVLLICFAFLFAWPQIVQKIWPDSTQQTPPVPQTDNVATETSPAEQPVAKTDKPAEPQKQDKEKTASLQPEQALNSAAPETRVYPKKEKLLPSVKLPEFKPVYLENDFIRAEINPNTAEVASVVLKKYKKSDLKNDIVLFENSAGATKLEFRKQKVFQTDADLKVKNQNTPDKTAIFKRKFKMLSGEAFEVIQTWKILKDYTIFSSVTLNNLSDKPLSLKNLYITAGSIPKISVLGGDKVFRENHEIDYYDMASDKVVSKSAEPGHGFWSMLTGSGKNAPKKGFVETVSTSAKWIGLANRYFSCILVPSKPFTNGVVLGSSVHKLPDATGEYIMAEGGGILDFNSIPPGGNAEMTFKYYAGPLKIELLREVDPSATQIMKLYMLGMRFLEPLSRGMLYMLIWLKNWCGSYGLGIILLTLIVRTIFWPVSHYANRSMRKMQKIQPLMKEIRKKYKDNPQQMNMEIMKLYKEHNVNPMSGCLPVLLQMPVFLALYATLSGSVEPRHTAFMWMNDLSMPDTVAHIFSLPINPLMIMMTATMLIQQKLTPSAADPQQQKMMMFMPLIMLVMLYNLPSGLTLYWTVSQFISIAQLIVNKELEKRAELKEKSA